MVNKNTRLKILIVFTLFLSFSINAFCEEKLFFVGSGTEGYGLYVHDDKTTEYLKKLAESNKALDFTVFKKKLYFAGKDSLQGNVLFVTDGTKGGTRIVETKDGLKPVSPYELTIAGDKLYFSASDSSGDIELWVTDGTKNGTEIIDINKKDKSIPQELIEFNSKLYFAATDEKGRELWVSDGTESGTKIVKDIHESGHSHPRDLTVAGNKLFFTASNAKNGRELWVSDGTESGTKLVKDINDYNNHSSGPDKLTVAGDKLFFTAYNRTNGRELWVSDGTEPNTKRVTDIWQGKNGSFVDDLTVVGNKLFFTATDGSGNTLWSVDTLNSNKVTNIFKNTSRTNPSNLTAFKNKLFFTNQKNKVNFCSSYDINNKTLLDIFNSYTNVRDFKVFDNKLFLILNKFNLYIHNGNIGNVYDTGSQDYYIKDLQVFNKSVYFIRGSDFLSKPKDNQLMSIPTDLTSGASLKLSRYNPKDMIVADVEAPNNPPTSENTKFIIGKEKGKTFSASDFVFGDSDVGDSFNKIKLINPEDVAGDLKLKIDSGYSDRLSGNQDLDVADLNNLQFFPAENASAGDESAFLFKVSDGKDYSSAEYTCTLKINTPPVISSTAVTSAVVGLKYTYNIQTSDSDQGQKVIIKVKEDLPGWLSLKESWLSEVFAGKKGQSGESGNGGDRKEALLDFPRNFCEDKDGNIYIGESYKQSVRKVDKSGIITNFLKPKDLFSGIAMDNAGNFYYSCYDSNIYKVSAGQKESSLILSGNNVYKRFYGLFADDNFLYATVSLSNKVIKIDLKDKSVETIAGTGIKGKSVDENDPLKTQLNNPTSVVKDSKGNIYIADRMNGRILKISSDSKVKVIGEGSYFEDLCLDNNDNVYCAAGNHNIFKIDSKTEEISKIYTYESYLYGIDWISSGFILTGAYSDHTALKLYKNISALEGTPKSSDKGKHTITISVSDGIDEVEQNFTITVKPSNNPPVSSNAEFVINEDTTKTFSLSDFNFHDDENDSLDHIRITALPGVGTFALGNNTVRLNQEISASEITSLKFTPAANASGSPYAYFKFKVNDGKADSEKEYTVTIKVVPVNDALAITSTPVTNAQEDTTYTYNLTASDIDSSSLTWTLTKAPSWITLNNKTLSGTPANSDTGTHEVIIKVSNGLLTDTQTFNITVTAVNDVPEIDSNDPYYDKNTGIYSREVTGSKILSGKIHATDEEGSTTVFEKAEGHRLPKGFTIGKDGKYTFDSSLYSSLKEGEEKTVKAYLNVKDENGGVLNLVYEIKITGKNDAPEIGKINNIIKYKNFDEVVIPVQVNDPDNNTNELVFSLEVKDPSIAEISLENNNQIRIVSEPGISGSTGISLKVSDGEKTSVMTFKLKVLSIEDGDNVDEAGDVEVEVEGDVTKTKVKVPEDGIEIETKEDESTGNVEYDLNQNNKNSHAKSEIKGSKVDINNKGAEIIYEEEDLELKVSSTITGETRDQITKNGKTTEFISKIPGGDTKIDKKDSKVEIETDLKVWETKEIKAVVGEDGSFKEEVAVNGKTTKISTKVPGSKTILDENELLKTNLELNKGSGDSERKINAVAITDPKGESQTWFEENGKVLERTINEKTPLETGTEIEIIQDGLEIEFRIKTDLTRELIIE